jgi:DNA-binding SARP family transcriptional activator
MGVPVRVRALGPLELHCDGHAIALGPPKQQTVLALLVTHANTTVPIDQLADELWAEHPPASAAANLRTYTANLRRLLAAWPGAPVIVRRHVGYQLELDPADLDLVSFRGLTTAGRTALLSGEPASVPAAG